MACFRRCLISSISAFGVAMPLVAFFWNACSTYRRSANRSGVTEQTCCRDDPRRPQAHPLPAPSAAWLTRACRHAEPGRSHSPSRPERSTETSSGPAANRRARPRASRTALAFLRDHAIFGMSDASQEELLVPNEVPADAERTSESIEPYGLSTGPRPVRYANTPPRTSTPPPPRSSSRARPSA